eukprot:SAG31_NODE_4233_length_3434_cov_1.980810_2_plen_215_part_00
MLTPDATWATTSETQLASHGGASSLLPTPRHAGRFVSLLPVAASEATSTVLGDSDSVWSGLHCLLARGAGTVPDHCNLLCSLLLGYGLDAYVCVGASIAGEPRMWVVTLDSALLETASSGPAPPSAVTYWDAAAGKRYAVSAVSPPEIRKSLQQQAGLDRVFLIYSDKAIHGNRQSSDDGFQLCWDLTQTELWHPVHAAAWQPQAQCCCSPASQ